MAREVARKIVAVGGAGWWERGVWGEFWEPY